jgi:hypothetical protein
MRAVTRPAELRRFDSAEFFGGRATSRGPGRGAGRPPPAHARENHAFDPAAKDPFGDAGEGWDPDASSFGEDRDPAADPGSTSDGAGPARAAGAQGLIDSEDEEAERLYLLSLEVDEETAGAAAGGRSSHAPPSAAASLSIDAGEHAENVGGDESGPRVVSPMSRILKQSVAPNPRLQRFDSADYAMSMAAAKRTGATRGSRAL